MSLKLLGFWIIALSAAAASAATGGLPLTLTQSGYLVDASDAPITNPALVVTFRVYDRGVVAGDETLEWEGSCAVAVRNGYYTAVLGEGACAGVQPLDSADVPLGSPRWIEVALGTVKLTPRLPIAVVPLATTAATALSADTLGTHPAADFALAGHQHTASAITDFASAAVAAATASGAFAPVAHTHAAASATTTGFLTSADWSTFNGKLGAEVDPKIGTLTSGKWCTSNGTTVSCTSTPAAAGVTSVGAGTGLTGGPITTSGSLAIGNDAVTSTLLATDAASLAKVSGGAASASGAVVSIPGSLTVNGVTNASVPRGVIVMWSGAVASVPAGWAVCDGANGTPDLRGKFSVGYDAGDADYNAIGRTGGGKTHSHSDVTGRTDLIANAAFGGKYLMVRATSGGGAGCDSQFSDPIISTFSPSSNGGSYSHGSCAEWVGIHGQTNTATAQPPYYVLAYLMKL